MNGRRHQLLITRQKSLEKLISDHCFDTLAIESQPY